MADIVLAVPLGAASFQRAQEVVSEEVAARVLEWSAVTQIVDSTAYIPLRTDWMPPRDRRTADGVELLLAGRWPVEVQAAIAAGRFARVSGRVIGELWKCIAACGLSRENDTTMDSAQGRDGPSDHGISEAAAAPAETTAERTNPNEDGPSEVLEEAPVVIHIHATPVNHVDGWSWSHVVTEIRAIGI